MTDTKKYSVIIPVYNAEKTLARCLKSVLDQKRDDVELVVVNDGSSDGSDGIVSDFLKTNENIVYIRQENAGVSRARNVGMERASGEYIVFLDGDDYIEHEYFSELDRMDETDSDLVVFAYRNHGELTGKDTEQYEAIAKAENSEKRLELLLLGREIMPPWNKRFKRSIIEQNHLRFIENLQIGEDFNFCLAYAMQCQTISVSSKAIYIEDVTDAHSLSRKYRPHLDTQMQAVFHCAAATIQESSVGEAEKSRLLAIADYLYIKNIFSCISEEFKKSAPSYRKDRARVKGICKQFSEPLSRSDCSAIHRVLRGLLHCNCYFVFYAASVLVKRRAYSKYMEESAS
ncbi:MAG: glycosyltransferase [Clostridiales bacterium]|nr:glycosyltransferase [Clostridiales bacterium]